MRSEEFDTIREPRILLDENANISQFPQKSCALGATWSSAATILRWQPGLMGGEGRGGFEFVEAVDFFRGAVKVGEALGGRSKANFINGVEDAFLGHDEAVTLVEEIIAAQIGRGEVDGDEVCAGAEAAIITRAGFGDIEGADGGDDPIRPHEAEGGHAVEREINIGGRRRGQRSFFAGNERADAAAIERKFGGKSEIGEQVGFGLVGQTGDKAGTDAPAGISEMANVFEAFGVIAGSVHCGVGARSGDFEFDDVDARAGVLKFGVKIMIERAQANADAEGCFAAEGFDERQGDFTDGDEVFAGLDVDIGYAGRAMVNEQFGELVATGAEAGELLVLAAHSAIGTVFAAEIGDFNDGANESAAAEFFKGKAGGALMKRALSGTPQT